MAASAAGGAGAGAGAGAGTAASSTNQPIVDNTESINHLARLLQTVAATPIPEKESDKLIAPLTLTFKTATEHTYTTTLDVTIQNYAKDRLVTFRNDCIFIEISSDDVGTSIHGNSRRQCFYNKKNGSRLQTTELGDIKTTATTVLQVLKLKILLAYPEFSWVTLLDEARIGDVQMTPFRLLRGGSAFYEKYGFSNKYMDQLKYAIQHTEITFLGSRRKLIDTMKDIPFEKEMTFGADVSGIILHIPTTIRNTDRFVDISLNNSQTGMANEPKISLSSILFSTILDYYSKNGVRGLKDKWDTFMFNPKSKEWNAIKNTVLLLDAVLGEFKPTTTATTGGHRRRIKNLKTRRNKHTRKGKGASLSTRK